jgi:hypothetical protein
MLTELLNNIIYYLFKKLFNEIEQISYYLSKYHILMLFYKQFSISLNVLLFWCKHPNF